MPHKSRRLLAHYRVLMGQCWAALGSGKITEAFIKDVPGCMTDGWIDDGSKHITVNPVHATADTVLHELVHRVHPEWKEQHVRRMTTILRREMSDDERIAFHEEYQRRVKRRKHPLDVRGSV